jgi:hypothetical protein
MRTAFFILFGIACIIYTGKPSINFQLFSIGFEKPYLPFATLFLILAILLYSIQYEKIGYKNGVKDTIEIVEDVFKDFKENKL